jgi:hypothetical protein
MKFNTFSSGGKSACGFLNALGTSPLIEFGSKMTTPENDEQQEEVCKLRVIIPIPQSVVTRAHGISDTYYCRFPRVALLVRILPKKMSKYLPNTYSRPRIASDDANETEQETHTR